MKPYTNEALKIAHNLFYKQDPGYYRNFKDFHENWKKDYGTEQTTVEIDAVRAILEAMGYDPKVKEGREIFAVWNCGTAYLCTKDTPNARRYVEAE